MSLTLTDVRRLRLTAEDYHQRLVSGDAKDAEHAAYLNDLADRIEAIFNAVKAQYPGANIRYGDVLGEPPQEKPS